MIIIIMLSCGQWHFFLLQANWVFDTLYEVKRVAKKWTEKVPSLVTLSETASGMPDLQVRDECLFLLGCFLKINILLVLISCFICRQN